MDTISRENNSMLPVGGIIVGVIALLLGGFAAIKVSSLQKTVTDHQPKIDKIDGIESQAASAAAAAEKTAKDLKSLKDSTQEAFNTVGPALADLKGSITKLEEAQKKAPVASSKKGGSGEPVVAGPGEYVVKSGDSGAKIARANGVSIADLQAVNPGVDWTKLKVGQKVKLPSTAKKS